MGKIEVFSMAFNNARYTHGANWRKGQTAFNVLYEVDPELADEIRGTELDPFYVDDRLDVFFQHIFSYWGEDGVD